MPAKLWCFFGVHEYEVIKTGRWRAPDTGETGSYYHSRCKICGKIKQSYE